MKICVAQVRPFKGDIPQNIANHKRLINAAITQGADLIIFPELSLTGYEPELAKVLATHPDDSRLDDFQIMSDAAHITIGVGLPTQNPAGICISMVLFQPHTARAVYSKKYLHADEEPFFISGQSTVGLIGPKNDIALAICYELSVPEHSENAFRRGATVYLTSVAKSADGVDKAMTTLADIARQYGMTALMSNCIGYCDNFESAGKTAILDSKGTVVGQMDDRREGLLMINTDTGKITEKTV